MTFLVNSPHTLYIGNFKNFTRFNKHSSVWAARDYCLLSYFRQICFPSFECLPSNTFQGDLSDANEATTQRGGVNSSVSFCDEKILSNRVQETAARPACVGILKTPGKRKTSNNRVEFLDNLQEREIPGRYT